MVTCSVFWDILHLFVFFKHPITSRDQHAPLQFPLKQYNYHYKSVKPLQMMCYFLFIYLFIYMN